MVEKAPVDPDVWAVRPSILHVAQSSAIMPGGPLRAGGF